MSNINKVTAYDVQKAAQKYLGVNKSAVSIALPKEMECVAEKVKTQHSAKKLESNSGIDRIDITGQNTLVNIIIQTSQDTKRKQNTYFDFVRMFPTNIHLHKNGQRDRWLLYMITYTPSRPVRL